MLDGTRSYLTGASFRIDLTLDELRAVTNYATGCARPALFLFKREYPGDARPDAAVEAGQIFANGGKRTMRIRDCSWAALRAAGEARDAGHLAAAAAARAAAAAAGSAYLHPLAKATQVKHILGPAAYATLAFELCTDHGPTIADKHLENARTRADSIIVEVLRRFPLAPSGDGRVGELIRQLDVALRGSPFIGPSMLNV